MRIVAASLVLFCSCSLLAQAPRPAEQIQRDIAELKKKLAALEAELAKVPGDKKQLNFAKLQVGDVGIGHKDAAFNAMTILSPTKMIAWIPVDGSKPFIVKGIPTKGLNPDASVTNLGKGKINTLFAMPNVMKVTGTEKIKNVTYLVLEPFSEPKAKD